MSLCTTPTSSGDHSTIYTGSYSPAPCGHVSITSYLSYASVPDNCQLCDLLWSGELAQHSTYNDMFDWLIRTETFQATFQVMMMIILVVSRLFIFYTGLVLKGTRSSIFTSWKMAGNFNLHQESGLRLYLASLGHSTVPSNLETEVKYFIYDGRVEGEEVCQVHHYFSLTCLRIIL